MDFLIPVSLSRAVSSPPIVPFISHSSQISLNLAMDSSISHGSLQSSDPPSSMATPVFVVCFKHLTTTPAPMSSTRSEPAVSASIGAQWLQHHPACRPANTICLSPP
jgi:hypothetical protein